MGYGALCWPALLPPASAGAFHRLEGHLAQPSRVALDRQPPHANTDNITPWNPPLTVFWTAAMLVLSRLLTTDPLAAVPRLAARSSICLCKMPLSCVLRGSPQPGGSTSPVPQLLPKHPCPAYGLGGRRSRTMAGMEVDSQPSTSQAGPAPVELPTLALDVLQIVKDAQSLHGLKHSDYERYRHAPTPTESI